MILPAWKDVDNKHDRGEALTALEKFIHGWCPTAEDGEQEFCDDLAKVIEEARNANPTH